MYTIWADLGPKGGNGPNTVYQWGVLDGHHNPLINEVHWGFPDINKTWRKNQFRGWVFIDARGRLDRKNQSYPSQHASDVIRLMDWVRWLEELP